MMKLALMRTATRKEDPDLPLLQRIRLLELTAPQNVAQVTDININCSEETESGIMVEMLQRNHY